MLATTKRRKKDDDDPFHFFNSRLEEVSTSLIANYLSFGSTDDFYISGNAIISQSLFSRSVQLTHGDAFEKEPQNGYKPAKTSSPKHDLTLDLAYEVFLKGLKIYWDCIGFAAVCTRRVARLHEKLQKTRIPEETEGENENDLHPVIVDLTKVRTFIECDNYNRRSYQFRSPAFPGQREIVLDGIIVLEHPNRHPKDANQFQSIVSVLYYEKQR